MVALRTPGLDAHIARFTSFQLRLLQANPSTSWTRGAQLGVLTLWPLFRRSRPLLPLVRCLPALGGTVGAYGVTRSTLRALTVSIYKAG